MSNSSKNKNSKVIVLAGIILLSILAVLFFIFKSFLNNESTIAFYGLSKIQVEGIEKVLDELCQAENLKYKYIVYDSDKKLESQIPLTNKPEIIFTTSGYPVETAVLGAEKKAGISSDVLASMTNSMKNGAKFNNSTKKVSALPILTSHLEVDVETASFKNSKLKEVNTWENLESLIKNQLKKTANPIAFAGKDSNEFLDIMGAFAESLDGEYSYTQAKEILTANAKKFNAAKVAGLLCDESNSPFATSVKLLNKWYKLGYIQPGTFSFSITDVEAYAQNKLATILFISLDEHRSMNNGTIGRYSSTYYLSERGGNERIFTGRITYAIPLKSAKKIENLISKLASTEIQEKLSRYTGLAPVLAQCRTPDSQATEVRWWIAATKTPLPGLSREVYLTSKQKTALSAEITARIQSK